MENLTIKAGETIEYDLPFSHETANGNVMDITVNGDHSASVHSKFRLGEENRMIAGLMIGGIQPGNSEVKVRMGDETFELSVVVEPNPTH